MSRAYEKSTAHSLEKLAQLREVLGRAMPPESTVVTYGSYARHEASDQSDLDYVVVSDLEAETSNATKMMATAKDTISDIVPTEPSSKGAFANMVSRDQLLTNVGGNEDTNDTITRRVLLLLEGEWLTNEERFKEIKHSLIKKYVDATHRDHQIALFMLNDIIRYWRTMTVDYTYKATEDGKPWAIRNIKLMFSRKLMYAGGMFSVGMTVDRGQDEKLELLERLLSMPPIERLQEICGERVVSRALDSYGNFLDWLSEKSVRDHLDTIKMGDHDDKLFRQIKNEGHHFTRELMKAYEQTFDCTHPIRRAILF